jgi:hypothetical protein
MWLTMKTPFSQKWERPMILVTTPQAVTHHEDSLQPDITVEIPMILVLTRCCDSPWRSPSHMQTLERPITLVPTPRCNYEDSLLPEIRTTCELGTLFSLWPTMKTPSRQKLDRPLWPWCPPLNVTHHEDSLQPETRKTDDCFLQFCMVAAILEAEKWI